MPASVLDMSMSLDGYIAGPNDEPDNPGGDGFDRLHDWFGDFSRPSGPVGELFDEMHAFGAIVVGRRTAEQIDHWGGDRQGVRIFVPSHRPPGPSGRELSVGDIRERRNRQRDGPGEGRRRGPIRAGAGAYTAQWALEAGVLDELVIHQIPVLFGGGRRQFDVLPSRVELEVVRVIDTPDATHIRYRRPSLSRSTSGLAGIRRCVRAARRSVSPVPDRTRGHLERHVRVCAHNAAGWGYWGRARSERSSRGDDV